MEQQKTPSHVVQHDPHRCAVHGCQLKGTVSTTGEFVCSFHFGVSNRNKALVTQRITTREFLAMYKLAGSFLTGVTADKEIRPEQHEYANVDWIRPFLPKELDKKRMCFGLQLMQALRRYATHGITTNKEPNQKKKPSSEWTTAIDGLRGTIANSAIIDDF